MFAGVFADENDMYGVRSGGEKGGGVAAIELRAAAGRHGEEVETRGRSDRAEIDPQSHAPAPEEGQDQRNQHHAGASDEAGVGSSGVTQAGSLKRVAAKHEETEANPSENLLALEGTQHPGPENRHAETRQRKTHG